jgi:predicted nicotinamide N-methyase
VRVELGRDGECATFIKGASSGTAAALKLRGASVLELGCGHGLPAIAAATRGAKRVVFADYNPEVLSSLTIPNVRANFAQLYDAANAAAAPPPSTSFVGGDWSDLPRFVPRASADVVLAAETIYAPESYDAHVAALTHAMKARSHSHWSPYDRVRVVNAVP